MPDTARTRTGLQASAGTDDVRTIDDTMKAAFDALELSMPLDSQGTAAPTGTGKRGEWYLRTTTSELFRSTGTAWVNVGAMLSDGAIDLAGAKVTGVLPWAKLAHPAQVTALPGSPVDGQEVYYVFTSNSVEYLWHLRYRAAAASTHKWEVLGSAPPVSAFGQATVTSSAAGTWVAPTGALSLTPPLPGTYEVLVECVVMNGTGTVATYGFSNGATAPSFDGAAYGYETTLSTSISKTSEIEYVSGALGEKLYGATSGVNYFRRRLSFRPIRVG